MLGFTPELGEGTVTTANARQQPSKVTLVTSCRAAFLPVINPTKPRLTFEAPIITSGRCRSNASGHVQESFMKWRDRRKSSVLWVCWTYADVHSDSARADGAILTTRLFWMGQESQTSSPIPCICIQVSCLAGKQRWFKSHGHNSRAVFLTASWEKPMCLSRYADFFPVLYFVRLIRNKRFILFLRTVMTDYLTFLLIRNLSGYTEKEVWIVTVLCRFLPLPQTPERLWGHLDNFTDWNAQPSFLSFIWKRVWFIGA